MFLGVKLLYKNMCVCLEYFGRELVFLGSQHLYNHFLSFLLSQNSQSALSKLLNILLLFILCSFSHFSFCTVHFDMHNLINQVIIFLNVLLTILWDFKIGLSIFMSWVKQVKKTLRCRATLELWWNWLIKDVSLWLKSDGGDQFYRCPSSEQLAKPSRHLNPY